MLCIKVDKNNKESTNRANENEKKNVPFWESYNFFVLFESNGRVLGKYDVYIYGRRNV